MVTYSLPRLIPRMFDHLRLCFLVMMFLGSPCAISHGQVTSAITPDGTLGTSVTKNGPVHDINGGTIKGTNQFHSFGKFSVGTGDTASFNGPSSIANILSRVTGGLQSQIDGTLKSTISGANLYLMNPAGVLFGPNASLDLSGSLHVTTADYLRLTDNVQFLANPDLVKDSLLTTAPVAAFGFLTNSPAPITVQESVLEVATGQTLSLIGGDITITGGDVGYQAAPDGRINIVSVASAGEAVLSLPDSSPDIDVSAFSKLGLIQLLDLALLDASGDSGGTVLIRGGQLVIESSDIYADTTGNSEGRHSGIDMRITEDALIQNSFVSAGTFDEGHGGDIHIRAGSLSLDDFTEISTLTEEAGRAGDILVNASSVSLTNSAISSSTTGTLTDAGNAGNLTVQGETVTLANGGRIDNNAFGAASAGNVTVTASGPVLVTGLNSDFQRSGLFSTAKVGSSGNAGDISVTAKTLTVQDRGQISTEAIGSGNAGAVSITASDAIVISGGPPTRIGSFAGTGDSGQITLTAPNLMMVTGAIGSSTRGSAAGGEIVINVDSLTLTGGAQIRSDTFGAGSAGNLIVTASGPVSISGLDSDFGGDGSIHSALSSSAFGTGNGGQVIVTATTMTVQDGGQISGNTFGSGNAGAVSVTASDNIVISGAGTPGSLTGIFSQAVSGSTGDAGQVTVTAPTLTLGPGGQISARSLGEGETGQIILDVPNLKLEGGFIDGQTPGDIIFDGSLGASGQLVTGPDFLIGADRGQIRGSNLFHSFRLFNVLIGESATFTGDSSINNILARVTGGAQSHIDGALRVSIPDANLYLMNPAGVLFGPNASLDLGGSFHVTTADYLRLSDNVQFFAKPDIAKDSLLTNAPVAAFGFATNSPAPITIQESVLEVASGQTLSLIGGDITVTGGPLGFQAAPSGRINIVSVASPGEAILSLPETSPDIDVSSFSKLGLTRIENASLDASGSPGGTVLIRGGKLIIDSSEVVVISTGTSDASQIAIDIRVSGDTLITNDSGLFVAGSSDAGRAGNIQLKSGDLQLNEFAAIITEAGGASEASDITIDAKSITLTNGAVIFSDSQSQKTDAGKGGNITVQAEALTLVGGSQISSRAFRVGSAGNVTITSSGPVSITGVGSGLFSDARPRSSGNAGQVVVTAKTVTLQDGGQISTDTFRSGDAGTVSVTASDAIVISGAGAPLHSTGITSQASPGSEGNAGAITVTAKTLTLQDAGVISSGTFGPGNAGVVSVSASDILMISGAGITTSTSASGNAGNITVAAQTLTMDGPGTSISASTGETGKGGDITVNANNVTLTEFAAISSSSSGTMPSAGNAGSLTIQGLSPLGSFADVISLSRAAALTTTADAGAGGSISLAARTITLDGGGISAIVNGGSDPNRPPAGITVRSTDLNINGGGIFSNTHGAANAGAIKIDANRVILTLRGRIETITALGSPFNAIGPFHAGDGGDILISANTLDIRPFSRIDSSDRNFSDLISARAGNITISAADSVSISGQRLLDPGEVFDPRTGIFSFSGNAGGTISISTRNLGVTNGGTIDSSTFRAGRGGDIRISASDTVSLSGLSDPFQPTGLFSATIGSGQAGTISVKATNLNITRGASIDSGTRGSGRGGSIELVISDQLIISGTTGGLFSRAGEITELLGSGISGLPGDEGSGPGGAIRVETGELLLTDRATISTRSTKDGQAGNIFVQANDTFVSRNSFITTQALQGDGGNIDLHVANMVHLINSEITTTVQSGSGNGGNITIDPQLFILDHSRIIANAFGGNGGNIHITAGVFLTEPSSILSASSTLGVSGTINIESPVQNLSGKLSPLPSNLLTIAPLTSQCAARAQGGSFSSFTVAGRDGVPAEPGGLLPSPMQQASVLTASGQQAATSSDPSWPLPLLLAMNFDLPCPP